MIFCCVNLIQLSIPLLMNIALSQIFATTQLAGVNILIYVIWGIYIYISDGSLGMELLGQRACRCSAL